MNVQKFKMSTKCSEQEEESTAKISKNNICWLLSFEKIISTLQEICDITNGDTHFATFTINIHLHIFCTYYATGGN